MHVLRNVLPGLALIFLASSSLAQGGAAPSAQAVAPGGQLALRLVADQPASGGSAGLHAVVEFHGQRLLDVSRLGLDLAGQQPLGPGMHLVTATPETADDTYTLPVGKTRSVRDHYNGVRATLEDGAGRRLIVEARAFDDGVAFRYIVPAQDGLGQVRITQERTAFTYVKDAVTYPLILDGFHSSYEDEYQVRMVSGLHPGWLIGLPYLCHEAGLGWFAITEADIDNYAGMYLRKAPHFGGFTLDAALAPRGDDPSVAVETHTPFSSPWRVVMVADTPAKLIESNIVLNLNPPSQIKDTSWIVAGKSAWDWWSGEAAPSVKFKTGMNTATMKHYIDFASASGFRYMLIDAGWAQADRNGPQDYAALANITQVTPEIDMPELLRYAREKHVKIWLWSHWTSVDKYMDQAFPLFEKWGIAGVKIDFMNSDDQQMVGWYRHVVETAAKYHLMIDFHGAFKPDGLRRTWPNLVTREGVMGKEYLKWSARTTPAHNATLPFTRMLAGPMDYTPGAFGNSNLKNFVARNVEPMSLDTRAQELALYVLFESPLQMVSDYPEHYAGQKEFAFLKRVPTTWDEVHAIGGQPMEWISLARRSGQDWYVGSITNWDARTIQVPLSFLGAGKYEAEIYADAPDAAENATHTTLSHQAVDRSTVLTVHMVSGGGNAIWIHPAGGH